MRPKMPMRNKMPKEKIQKHKICYPEVNDNFDFKPL